MSSSQVKFDLIEDKAGLERFFQDNRHAGWMAFDTEFVGEKRFQTLLCLIQVTTSRGHYLIDPFPLPDLGPFLQMVESPEILKITHAGDNDYRLLYNLYGTVPKHIFDTQIAAGFLGYRYPVSFRKLVEGELRLSLNKGYAVADWESRPFQKRQLTYALEDVVPLYDLWYRLDEKLRRHGRLHWAAEEFARLEEEAYYMRDPHQEALGNNLMKSLKPREQVFLLRLMAWRRELAREKDHSKEMVLPAKLISLIIRSLPSGKDALKKNRRIPDRITDRYGDVFIEMYNRPMSEEEKELLKQIPASDKNDLPEEDVMLDLLYLLIKHKANSQGVSASMVFPRNMLEKMKQDPSLRRINGWRRELMGDTFMHWIENLDHLQLDVDGGNIQLSVV